MEKHIDPRTLRTRKLIMDAFLELLTKQDFKDFTIGNITSAATVNRATFYNHFIDKYDLLDKVLHESVMREVLQEVSTYEDITEETIRAIFISIINFHISISKLCPRSYKTFSPQTEIIFKRELQAFFTKLVKKKWANQNRIGVETFAVMLSWSLYGAAIEWLKDHTTKPEDYVKQMLHFINLE